MMNVKLCMMVVLTELYLFIPLSVTLIVLHYYNFAWGLPIHTRFEDLDFVSRLQICQNHELQIGF